MAIKKTTPKEKRKALTIAEKYTKDHGGEGTPFTPVKERNTRRMEGYSAFTFDMSDADIYKLNMITFRSFNGKKRLAREDAFRQFLDQYDMEGYLKVDEEEAKPKPATGKENKKK
tara:strand:- start:36 stop:380 length:345 start_codon:yes stop_codon:yes gene_type:complete